MGHSRAGEVRCFLVFSSLCMLKFCCLDIAQLPRLIIVVLRAFSWYADLMRALASFFLLLSSDAHFLLVLRCYRREVI